MHADLAADLAACDRTHADALAAPASLDRLRVLQPEGQNRSTPRELTALLAAVWRDELVTPAACRALRRALRLQVWPHRLASGFPDDTVGVTGKTGTLPPLRSEIGVVEHADGRRYAVAVFTRSSRPTLTDPDADAVIGATAVRAVDHLAARDRST